MTIEELKRKADDIGLTVEEVIEYQKLVKPVRHVYGKYGTLKKKYIEEHYWIKAVLLGEHLPDYLHKRDEQASDLYDRLYARLSAQESYRRTGNYIEDVQRENSIKGIIEEEILTTLIYEECV